MVQATMRILYLGANVRMRMSTSTSPEIRALGLKQALEQAGFEVIPFMAGDEVNSEEAQKIYSKQLKRLMPRHIHATMRDIYEIVVDWRFYRAVETRLQAVNPSIILQQHARYAQAGVRLGRRYNIPVFLDDITPIWEEERHSDRSLKLIARQIRKGVFSQASGLIAVTSDMETQLRSEGVPSRKIHVVPNGVDCKLFNPETTSMVIRQKYGLEDKVVIGYVGGMQEWHRLDLLLRVASPLIEAIPHIQFLLVVGKDPDKRLESMVRERGLTDWFTFSGGVPHSEVPAYINAMDIAILPGIHSYMSPLKIYEYMAMGKPVIAPNKNLFIEELVIPHQHGLLFEAEDANSMKNAIMTLALDPEIRQKMGKEAIESAQKNYTWYQQANKLIQVFRAALPLSVNQAIS